MNQLIADFFYIRLKTSPRKVSIIQAYAPTSNEKDEEIETFYESIERTMKQIPKRGIIVIMGDWNAKIGKDKHAEWKVTAGKFGLGAANERGLRLTEFAKVHNLVVTNTKFNHKESR